MKAKDVMSRQVITVTRTTSVEDIARLLGGYGIRGVPVVDDERKVVGIVTEGDFVTRLVRLQVAGPLDVLAGVLGIGSARQRELWASKIAGIRAADIMTPDVVTVTEDTPLSAVAEILIDRRFSQMPVVGADGALVGIISRGDIVRALAQ